MTAVRALAGIVATIFAIVAIPLAVIGFGLASFGADPTTTLPSIAVSTSDRALGFGEMEIRNGLDGDTFFGPGVDDIAVEVQGSNLFVGVGPADLVGSFIRGSSSPTEQIFWVVQASGDDPRLDLEVPDGAWSAVVMNADGTPGVDADVSVTIPSGPIRLAAALVLGAGVVTAGVSALLFYVAFRRPDAHPAMASRREEIVTR